MTVRIETCGANSTSLSFYEAGEFEELEDGPNEQPVLAFWYDECFLVEGTREELRALLTRALELVNA
jgi:hypothetical protein